VRQSRKNKPLRGASKEKNALSRRAKPQANRGPTNVELLSDTELDLASTRRAAIDSPSPT
jgi:hypothetical protein